jgi:hypothetical protein
VWIHITYSNFKWFNCDKIHIILWLFYHWSNIQVGNNAKSLKYTGESQRMHRNTGIMRAKVLRAVSLKTQVFCSVAMLLDEQSPGVLNWHSLFLDWMTQKRRNYIPSTHQVPLTHWQSTTSYKAWMFRNYAAGIFIILQCVRRVTVHLGYRERVISRNLRPPCSLDLMPPDFYLWEAAKSAVYRDCPRTLSKLKTSITGYIRNISQADLQKVFANKIKWVQACVDARGHHFQHLLSIHRDFPDTVIRMQCCIARLFTLEHYFIFKKHDSLF